MDFYYKNDLISTGNTIGIKRSQGCQYCDEHRHDYIEIVYMAEGHATQVIDGISYAVSRGDILFINCGATHAFSAQQPFSHVELFFSPTSMPQENMLSLLALSLFDSMRKDADGGIVHFHGEDRREVEFILSAMLREKDLHTAESKQITEHYFSILLAKMLRSAESTTLPHDILESLRVYIDDHPEEKLTLSELAAKCFYHPAYLSRAFKQKYGMPPSEYIRSRRILHAADLLRSTELPIETVMEQVGFTDRSTFYHAFSKAYGMTPAQYRKTK